MNPLKILTKALCLFTVLLQLFVTAPAVLAADSDVPGRKNITAAPVGLAEAHAVLSQRVIPALYDPAPAPVPAEIRELARGLKNDAGLIYAYVHDSIRYEAGYGAMKGALGTLLDGSGNAFDQASLMVELLRAAGIQAAYVHGGIQLTGAQASNWLGVADDADTIRAFLGSAGIPAETSPTSGNTPAVSVVIDHVWVEATVDGIGYAFDPAFKTHVITPPIDLASAMDYSLPDLLNQAGGTIHNVADDDMTDYSRVSGISRSGVRAALTQYAGNLIQDIRTNHPAAEIRDIVGGMHIEPAESGLRQTALPYQTYDTEEWSTGIPDTYQTFLRIADGSSLNVTFRTADIYGKRLTLFQSGNGTAALRLEGSDLAATTSGTDLILAVDHPYAAADDSGAAGTYGDQTGWVRNLGGADLAILTGLGRMGRAMSEHRRAILKEARLSGATDDSEAVLGETLGLYGLNYMAELSAMETLSRRVTGVSSLSHHSVGVVAQQAEMVSPSLPPDLGIQFPPEVSSQLQDWESNALFMDIPLTRVSSLPLSPGAGDGTALFLAEAGQASILESGVFDQSTTMSGISTVKALDQDNEAGVQVLLVTPANWGLAEPLVSAASPAAAEKIGELMLDENPWKVAVPLSAGVAMIAVSPGGDAARHLVGGRKGAVVKLDAGQTAISVLKAPGFAGVNNFKSDCPADGQSYGQPVDMADGTFYHAYEDITVGSNPENGLSFSRSYYSKNRLDDSGLGYGWGHNHSASASLATDAYESLGAQSPVKAAAAITAIRAAFDVLQSGQTVDKLVIASIIHTWLMEQLTNNIVSVSFPGGSNRFIRLPDGTFGTDSCCGPESLTREADGSFTMTSRNGDVYGFGPQGRLLGQTDPNGNTVTYGYDTDGHLVSVANSFGWSLTLSWVDDHIVQVSGGGRSVGYAYDTAGGLTSFTDAESHSAVFEYDDGNRLTKIYHPANPATPFVENTYDGLGRVMTQKVGDEAPSTYYFGGIRSEVADPLGHPKIWVFQGDWYHNKSKKAVSVTDESGRTTTYEYDGLMRLVRETRPEQDATVITYDARNNPLTVSAYPKGGGAPLTTAFTWRPDFAKVASVTDPLGRVTTFGYDAAGNLTSIQQPSAGGQTPVTSFAYNSQGLPVTVTDPSGVVTQYGYDSQGGVTSVTVDPGGQHLHTAFGYDSAGNLTSVTDPRGKTSVFSYDGQRRIVQAVDPAPFSQVTTFGYDADGRQTSASRSGPPVQSVSTAYSVTGLPLTVTGPRGFVTQYAYDALDRLHAVTDAEGRTTQYQYDEAGRLTAVIDGNGSYEARYGYTLNGRTAWVKDANNNQTTYTYDDYDRLVRTAYPGGTTEDLTLDSAGRVTAVKGRDGRTVGYGHDALDRLTSRTVPGAGTDTYAYDLAGRLVTAATTGVGAITHGYDSAGRLISVLYPGSRAVGYVLDAASNKTRITWPDGSYALYAYDELNRLTGIQYDPNASDQDPAPVNIATYAYDALGRRSSLTLGNGASAAYGYSLSDELVSLSHQTTGGTFSLAYGYDRTGLKTLATFSNDLFAPWVDVTGIKSFSANSLNQYTQAMDTVLAYDAGGNLASDGTSTFTHDALNRMTSAATLSGPATYLYGPLDRRMSRSVGEASVVSVYDGDRVIAEYDGAGNLLRKYVYGPGLDEPAVMVKKSDTAESLYYYHADALGSVLALSDASGTVAEYYRYTVYGKPSHSSALLNPYLFTGRAYDAETGLYYYRHRYYHPTLRRFIEPDPIGYAGGMNLYAYVGNDPVNWVDPWGFYRSPEYLRDAVPGQILYDFGRTAIENGEYGWAATYFAGMVGEQALTVLTVGNFQLGKSAGRCIIDATSRTELKTNSAGQLINARGQFLSEAGGESSATIRGRAAHEAFDEAVRNKPGWQSKPRIIDPDGNVHIPDALSPSGRPVELKPKTPSGIKRGIRQLKRYEQITGKKGRVIYY